MEDNLFIAETSRTEFKEKLTDNLEREVVAFLNTNIRYAYLYDEKGVIEKTTPKVTPKTTPKSVTS